MTITVITLVFDAVALIASGIAWRYAIQTRRSVRRIREIKGGGPR